MPPEPETILGIGVDLVDHEQLRRVLDRWGERFTRKIFRQSERVYCQSRAFPWRHFAGRFAVKEAVSKAFGTGIGVHIGWRDIEVVAQPSGGAPEVRLDGPGARLARTRRVRRILISLTHGRKQSIAQAVLVGAANEREQERCKL